MAAAALLRGGRFRVNTYRKTAVPTAFELHLMNRMGCGYSRSTFRAMRRAGGGMRWFEKQLKPAKVKESKKARALRSWYPGLSETPRRRWSKHRAKVKGGWDYAREFSNYSILRRMYTRREVLETMVDFWSNQLHIRANAEPAWVQRENYDRVIRKHALGRFDRMLEATTLHPAMLLYLDNWRSEKDAPNENHGRELLELHTVGRASGYTEQMVKDSAVILSGWSIDEGESWGAVYHRSKHTTGPVKVLGFSRANGSTDGRQLSRDYLRYLAHHPATSRTIARKLAVRFVSDSPSDALVNHLAAVFRKNDTDIKATLRALVRHPEFKRSAGKKVRTPVDDLVASVRALRVNAVSPRGDKPFSESVAWIHGGMGLYYWPRPDGAPERNDDWASASRMLSSYRMHWNLAGGWWPRAAVRYRPYHAWLPQKRIRFDKYVDHLCRSIHGQRSTSRMLRAAVQATGVGPRTMITREHAVAGWMSPRLLAVLLDSPEHMSR